VLECANKSDKVQWQKERTPLSIALDDDEDIVKIDNETGSLKILKDEKEAYGNYTCKAGNSTIEYKVVREYSATRIFYVILYIKDKDTKNNKKILHKTII